jgi:hypothetical protein
VQAVCSDSRRDVGEIQTAGEMVSVGEDESGPQLRITLELAVGESEFLQQGEIGCIAFFRPVEADEEHVPVALHRDSG